MSNSNAPTGQDVAEQGLVKLARSARKRGRDREQILAILRPANEACPEPLYDHDVERIAHLVGAAPSDAVPTSAEVRRMLHPPAANTSTSDDDITLSGLMAKHHGDRMRYVQSESRWYLCSKTTRPGIWSGEDRLGSYAAAKDTVLTYAPASVSDRKIRSVRSAAQHLLTARLSDFDRHPWVLGVVGGVVDLRTKELGPPRPELMLTRCAPVRYDPEARCPKWEANLLRLFDGDAERAGWFQMAVGMALVGDAAAKDHGFIYLLGPEGNGKSTVLKVLVHVLGEGEHAATLNAKDLSAGPERHLAWLHKLRGARLAVVAEARRQAMDSAKVNALTGADHITANRMRQEDETWEPTHTLFVASNYPLRLDGGVKGMRRRYKPVPTGPSLPATAEQTDFEEQLRAEAEGILAWAVEGCRLWQENGRRLPELAVMERARDVHLDDEDPWAEWAEERLVFKKDAVTSREDLVSSVNAYRKRTEQKALTGAEHKVLYNWLRDMEGVSEVKRKGKRFFVGVEVIPPPPPPPT